MSALSFHLPRTLRMARADFLERSRRFGFIVMLAASLYAGYGFLPPNHAKYVTLRFAEYRGIYNSAWVGAAISLLSGAFIGLIGFYLIKNAVERDRLTRVGQILAATPTSKFEYVLAKTISNFGVLASVALAVALAGGVTQIVRAEDPHVQPWQLLAPFLFLTLPSMLVISAVAAFFECMPGLRGGFGNVAYFFLWAAALAASGVSLRGSGRDFIGFGLMLPSMVEACKAAFPDYDMLKRGLAMGLNFKEEGVWNLTTFVWNGITWSADIAAIRLMWVLVALAIVFAGSLVFDRFAKERSSGEVVRKRWFRRSGATATLDASPAAVGFAEHYRVAALDPASLRVVSSSHFLRLLAAEVKLLLKGANRAWFVVMFGLWIACAVTPLEAMRRVLPLVWIWPVLVWSGMGIREARFGVDQILFSTPHPLRLQIPAAWMGGVVVAMLTGAVVAVRFVIAAEWGSLLAWVVGACFIPALALAMGVWTGSSRAFEGLYTAFWYMGPLQPIPAIDFMGSSRAAIEQGTPTVFALATLVLLALAFAGRKRQLYRA